MVRAILKNTHVTSWTFATSEKVTGVRMEEGIYICKGFYENKLMLVGKQVTPQQLNGLLLIEFTYLYSEQLKVNTL